MSGVRPVCIEGDLGGLAGLGKGFEDNDIPMDEEAGCATPEPLVTVLKRLSDSSRGPSSFKLVKAIGGSDGTASECLPLLAAVAGGILDLTASGEADLRFVSAPSAGEALFSMAAGEGTVLFTGDLEERLGDLTGDLAGDACAD